MKFLGRLTALLLLAVLSYLVLSYHSAILGAVSAVLRIQPGSLVRVISWR